MPVTSFFFFRRNDAGHNLETIVPVAANSVLTLDADLGAVFLPKSNFATSADLAAEVAARSAHSSSTLNPHSVTKAQVGLGNVLNVAQIPATDKGAAGGVATLDGGGKVPTSQLPSSVVGGMIYQTTWNASTNTPAIPTAAAGNNGWYYRVAVAGVTEINGIDDWEVGDWIVSNGSAWEKIDNTDKVLSVAGRQGDVTLVIGDIGGLSSALSTLTDGVAGKEPALSSPGVGGYVLSSTPEGVRSWLETSPLGRSLMAFPTPGEGAPVPVLFGINESLQVVTYQAGQVLTMIGALSQEAVDLRVHAVIWNTGEMATDSGNHLVDFNGPIYQNIDNATANITFVSQNVGVNATRSVVCVVKNNAGSDLSLTFPAAWRILPVRPTILATGKTGVLSVTKFGTADASVVASWAAEE